MNALQSRGREMLRCRKCGSVFREGKATRDGWRYECPQADCDGAGLGEALIRID